MLIPKNFVIKCVLNRDAYLNGCVLKWEATVQLSSPMQDSGAGSEVIMFNSASREYRPLFWTEVEVIDHWKNLVKRLVLLLV